nr:transcription elongation factor 1 homolog [Ipomoea batatas]GMD11516.1 transcription elongation factor 1 homolog [Ipomoea batatas]
MGKRKSKAKPPPKKRMDKLDTVFSCPFCSHGTSVECRIDMKNAIGEAICNICQESFSTTVTALTEPIDMWQCSSITKPFRIWNSGIWSRWNTSSVILGICLCPTLHGALGVGREFSIKSSHLLLQISNGRIVYFSFWALLAIHELQFQSIQSAALGKADYPLSQCPLVLQSGAVQCSLHLEQGKHDSHCSSLETFDTSLTPLQVSGNPKVHILGPRMQKVED